ncbi:UvrD-helicase domain-containing protein [Wenyingzhuangia sp. IMCC45533]
MESTSFFKVYNASAGSGKTFTLVKEYLKIVLTSGDFEFQKILAITFTNKAASEMKQRVLNTLKDASKNTSNPIVDDVIKETALKPKEIQEKATLVLSNILHNYASFNIITIDSFTHKLIRTFSLDLGLPLDFEVEMDAYPLLQETIDLLVAKIGEDKDLTKVLVSYALHQVNEDKSWNINDSLFDVSKLLLNEENEIEISKLINTSLADFQALEKRLKKYLEDTENAFKEVGTQALSLIDEHGITHNTFTYSDLPKYFNKLIDSWKFNEASPLSDRLSKNMNNGILYANTKPKDSKKLADRDKIDQIESDLFRLFEISQQLCEAHLGQYFLVKKILKSLVPLAVLSYINKEFTFLKEENNFRLNAEFNRFISNQIKDQPVPFIYERLGEKYQYFFIDEMQDTSELQWQNLIPLIDNSLSQGKGGLMLVGDAKQSIYRWRGGKASQFVALSDSDSEQQFFVEKEVITLGTNYRSYSNIINFNNEFFHYLSSFLQDPSYQEIYAKEKLQQTNSKEGGYVHLEVHEREEDFDVYSHYSQKIHQLITDVQSRGFNKGDICILTRKTKDGIALADYLVSQGIEVISPDSLLLKNNNHVKFYIFLLRWIENPLDKEVLLEVLYFLYEHLNIGIEESDFYVTCLAYQTVDELLAYLKIDFSVSNFFSQSLYDGVELVIRSFGLQDSVDVFVQAFLDLVLQFQLKESGGLQAFIAYWDRKKEGLKVEVAANKNAVQIMTIHKSKGLEFPVVIFPFDLNTEDINRETIWLNTQNSELYGKFDSFRINASNKLSMYGDEGEYKLQEVSKETQLDNFNLLYVALTRAEEQLYILSDTKESKQETTKNYSDYFKNYIIGKGVEGVYQLGDPNRQSEALVEKTIFSLDKFSSIDKKENQIYIVQGDQSFDDSRHLGNIIHQAFEKIISVNDIDKACNFIDQQGLDDNNTKFCKYCIDNVVNHPQLKEYYQESLETYNERSFITQSGEVNIMDRLVFKDNKVIILDYKTGKPSRSHQLQIENYANILTNMGYTVASKILIYCNSQVEINII